MTGRPRINLPRETAVADPRGRRCAHCGDFIDPKDWCPGCQRDGKPCGHPHRHLTKRADAAFCNQACRNERRASYIRDCL
jgi:hypothetical protein